ncbi:gamma-glutamylcyclotransferase family protein [Mucilaginibacter sp.]
MKPNSSYLFVYGTLLGDNNEFGIYLKQHCHFYDNGKLKGRLYDLGEYPGAVLDEDLDSYIHGSIVELIDPQQTLNYLDDYEGYGDDQDQPNLFIREIAAIETNSKEIDCWIYVYNLSIDGFKLIELGNYIKYKNI